MPFASASSFLPTVFSTTAVIPQPSVAVPVAQIALCGQAPCSAVPRRSLGLASSMTAQELLLKRSSRNRRFKRQTGDGRRKFSKSNHLLLSRKMHFLRTSIKQSSAGMSGGFPEYLTAVHEHCVCFKSFGNGNAIAVRNRCISIFKTVREQITPFFDSRAPRERGVGC